MEVYVDGTVYAVETAGTTTVSEVIQQIKEQLPCDDRIIVSVSCDGQLVEPERLNEVLTSAATAWGRLDFAAESPWDLGGAALRDASELFSEALGSMGQAADLLGQGQTVRAMEVLGANIAAWSQAVESVRRTAQLLGMKLDDMTIGDQLVPAMFDTVRELLSGVKESLEARDYVTLTDILQYELPATGEQWQAMIHAMLDRIEAHSPNG